MTDQPRPVPFSMTFTVWYRRIFLWGLALLLLPLSIQSYVATMQEWTGQSLPLGQTLFLLAALSVVWAIAAVLLTLAALSLAGLVDKTPEAGFRQRFNSWYKRIFVWGPGLLLFVAAVRAWLVMEGSWLDAAGPLVALVTVAVLWALVSVLIVFAVLGVVRLAKGANKA